MAGGAVEGERADQARRRARDVERVQPAVGDRVDRAAVGLDDVGLVDACLLHVRRREVGGAALALGGGGRRRGGERGARRVGLDRGRQHLRHGDARARRHARAAAGLARVATRIAEQRLAGREGGQRGRLDRALGGSGRGGGQDEESGCEERGERGCYGEARACGQQCPYGGQGFPPCRAHADTTRGRLVRHAAWG